MDYTKHFSVKETPQSERIPGRPEMVKNHAGGYGWEVDDWQRLFRFLLLGSEGGTYYVSERALTIENAETIVRLLKQDGRRVVHTIVETSKSGRAAKVQPALFALAIASAPKFADEETRRTALEYLPDVARTASHLMTFLHYADGLRGWGDMFKSAIVRWYESKSDEQLAYQMVKYKDRQGFSQKEIITMAHPKLTGVKNELLRIAVKGYGDPGHEPPGNRALDLMWADEMVRRAQDVRAVVKLIQDFDLPHEAIPSQWQTNPAVWKALIPKMPVTATLRTLNRMTAYDAIPPLSPELDMVADRITNPDILKRGRVHPVSVLHAMQVYKQGRGEKGSMTWKPVARIMDALDAAFYQTFQYAEGTGKRLIIGVDVSGSMWGTPVNGIPGLSANQAAAVMAMVFARTEKSYAVVPFDVRPYTCTLSPRQRLDDVVKTIYQFGRGGTDCAQPILWATANDVQADAVIILTDGESWAGKQHVSQAMEQYRQRSGLPVKLIEVAMASTATSTVDPTDALSMRAVGFDAMVPAIIGNFLTDWRGASDTPESEE